MKFDLEQLKKAYSLAKKNTYHNEFVAITKFDEDQRLVYGYISTEQKDCHNEIVSKDAIKKAFEEDYKKWGNIRFMHDNKTAVGNMIEYSHDDFGTFMCAKISDSEVWQKIKDGVLKGFSIGGWVIKKVGDTITDLFLEEISLVDRPANPGALVTCFKTADMIVNIEEDEKLVANLEKIQSSGLSLEDILNLVEQSKIEKANKEREEKEAREKILLEKGFYSVQDVVSVIGTLSWVLDDAEWENKWNNDDNTELLVELKNHILSLSDLAQKMIQNETKDLTSASEEVQKVYNNIEKLQPMIKLLSSDSNKDVVVVDNKEVEELKKSLSSKDEELNKVKVELEELKKNAIFENNLDTKTVEKNTDNKITKNASDVINELDSEIKEIKEKINKSADFYEKQDLESKLKILNMERNIFN